MRRLWIAVFELMLCMSVGCRRAEQVPPVDHPRLAPGVVLRDVTFRSASLNRDMNYRMLLPEKITDGEKYPVIYLLHGGGGSYLDWTNYTDVAQVVPGKFILVMPEGDESYFVNSATRPQDKYEDYITKDLIADVQQRAPASTYRRGIAGVSMGGFGAIVLGLKHPDLYRFVGAMSPALDAASRPFSIKRIGQWRHFRSIFGDWNGQEQRNRDPFVLARTAEAGRMPYIFFTSGDQEGLLAANREFASLLKVRGFSYEFHQVPGGHYWRQWSDQVEGLFKSASEHLPGGGIAEPVRVVSKCDSPAC